MKRWKGGIAMGVLALALAAALVTHPWSGPRIPTASRYSSSSDLARDLNEHGLRCAHPTQMRLMKFLPRYLAIWIDRRLLPKMLVCSVDGQPVVLSVYPPASLKVWFGSEPTPGDANLQDLFADRGSEGLRELGIDAMLVGPNWMVVARHERVSLSVLSAIQVDIGGMLVVAPSPTTPASSPTSSGPST